MFSSLVSCYSRQNHRRYIHSSLSCLVIPWTLKNVVLSSLSVIGCSRGFQLFSYFFIQVKVLVWLNSIQFVDWPFKKMCDRQGIIPYICRLIWLLCFQKFPDILKISSTQNCNSTRQIYVCTRQDKSISMIKYRVILLIVWVHNASKEFTSTLCSDNVYSNNESSFVKIILLKVSNSNRNINHSFDTSLA